MAPSLSGEWATLQLAFGNHSFGNRGDELEICDNKKI